MRMPWEIMEKRSEFGEGQRGKSGKVRTRENRSAGRVPLVPSNAAGTVATGVVVAISGDAPV